MPLRRSVLFLTLLAAFALAACDDDPELRVNTLVSEPITVQGGVLHVTVSGAPPDDDEVSAIILEVTGSIGHYDSVPFAFQSGTQSIDRYLAIPIGNPNGSGTVIGRARTAGGLVNSQTATYQVRDSIPPRLVLNVSPSTLHPGDTLDVYFEASDNVRVKYALLHYAGAMAFTDSLFIGAPGGSHSWRFLMPSTPNATSLTLTGFAVDYVGNTIDSALVILPYIGP